MSKVFNMVGGGGKNISSIIITGLTSTDTVTCTKDGKSYPATWDATAQHWEIVGLPLGTFTITATNGTKTITETVLIDIAGIYEIEMSFKLWLYRNGNKCEDVTGGWYNNSNINWNNYSNKANVYFNETNIAFFSTVIDTVGFVETTTTIDFTPYSKLVVKMGNPTGESYMAFRVTNSTSGDIQTMSNPDIAKFLWGTTDYAEYTLDVSNINGEYYCVVGWLNRISGNSSGTFEYAYLE